MPVVGLQVPPVYAGSLKGFAWKTGCFAQFFLNAQQLVVLGHAVRSRS
jgi:hypothetical protein